MAKRNKRGEGSVRWREDTGKYVIDYYDNLGKRHVETVRSIRIHDLRQTFASILISAGHNPKYIQNQMGHSSIQVTMDLYGHLMPEVHEGAAKKSEDFVFNAPKQVNGNVMVTEQQKGVTACAVTP